jgi:hypothetical protein
MIVLQFLLLQKYIQILLIMLFKIIQSEFSDE